MRKTSRKIKNNPKYTNTTLVDEAFRRKLGMVSKHILRESSVEGEY